ncbi:MAG: NAD(P)H-hydrate dehydratase [Clostridia bacterium]|nr:NAD(P)H-hydrate dehydratase [Clostridia bacterium]
MIKNSLNMKSASVLLPPRDPKGHKGSFGNVLLVCGSKNMVGCCVLAAYGALRSGAGLVTLAFPDALYTSLTSRLTENLFLPLPSDAEGFLSVDSVDTVINAAEKSDVVMVGCGIGTGEGASLLVKKLLALDSKPVIFDADAINCLCKHKNELKNARCNALLTPHPGEMSRLTDKSVSEIENSREECIVGFCREYRVNLLLKGCRTLICNGDATELFVNKTGNSGLAKGGSGDLLSGIIAGLTPAFNGDLFKAAILGAFVHGMSADVLKEKYSEYSILPSDCADALPLVYSKIEKGGAD